MNSSSLSELLRDYAENGRIPFHMPGHKRSRRYDYLNHLGSHLDITEIDGFDNLHDAEGILAQGMDILSQVYGSKRSFYLINGSTGGLLAAVRCAVPFGSEVIMARNCHKAVYNAVELTGAIPHYLDPPCDPDLGFCLAITPEAVEALLVKYPSSAAVILTSPTYDGIVSDIETIASVCRKRGIPLIVDEAHGAHLGFLDPSVKSAVSLGADIVIQSFHKTLPSLTQTAAAHICGNLISPECYAAELSVFETSSPSYLLLASLDGCTRLLADESSRTAYFSRWRRLLDEIDSSIPALRNTGVFMHPFTPSRTVPFYDRSKLAVSVNGMTGPALSRHLRDHGMEPEMTSAGYVLLMTGADTREEDIMLLLRTLAETESGSEAAFRADRIPAVTDRIQVMTPFEVRRREQRLLSLDELPPDAVSADYVFAYPPGIPVVAPGEVITPEVLAALRALLRYDLNPATLHGSFTGTIAVVR